MEGFKQRSDSLTCYKKVTLVSVLRVDCKKGRKEAGILARKLLK